METEVNDMDYIVETRQLAKRYGNQYAVQNLDMRIPRGAIYGFLGPNGAGKSTTIRMLLGLIKPSRGQVRIFGQDLNKHRIEILRKVGSLVENPSYYPHLTARENLETSRRILGVPKKRIDEVLDIVRLGDAADKKVKGFSLGMKQRLGIAASLLHQPELLILDEPTNGLDPSGIIEMRQLIRRLPREFGMTVLISSHLLSEIDQVATYVGVISKGHLIFQDTIEAMRKQATAQLLIRTDHNRQACQALLARGVKAELANDAIVLEGATDQQVARCVSMLVQDGFSVYRVEEQTRSLEDIFLHMTREERAS